MFSLFLAYLLSLTLVDLYPSFQFHSFTFAQHTDNVIMSLCSEETYFFFHDVSRDIFLTVSYTDRSQAGSVSPPSRKHKVLFPLSSLAKNLQQS